jgi:hypothetical protein
MNNSICSARLFEEELDGAMRSTARRFPGAPLAL